MSRAVKYASVLLMGACLVACVNPIQSDRVTLDLGDVEDYAEFLEDRGDVVKPVPFKPEPLFVSAIGKVQAQPDIAVITARITAEDKNESRAVNDMGEIINAVQTALAGRKIETGFTGIHSNREFDERCRNDNRFAIRRHNQIRSDYYFNKRLDDQGDTQTKRRVPKPRVAQKTCFAQSIEVSTDMVIRIEPASEAGDVLRALADAGAENSRFYFSVSAPERQGRFGPQPNVIRPANRYQGDEGSAIDRYIDDYEDYRPSLARERSQLYEADEVIVTGSRVSKQFVSPRPLAAPPPPSPRIQSWDGSVSDNVVSRPPNLVGVGSNANTNALSISLLSGPQTISVKAQLSYTYETPLNGKTIVEPDDET